MNKLIYKEMKYKKLIPALIICLLFTSSLIAQQRGFRSINIEINGQSSALYTGSHALIVGESNYTNGWSVLPGVSKDIDIVKSVLESHGFNVVVVENATSSALKSKIDNFISKYGRSENNRLVFYFSGHGYTLKMPWGGEMGYFVPVDAPNPSRNKNGFLDKAMDMEMIEVYAKRIQSKHALFLFDCCFSGSIFALLKSTPPAISYKTKKPVRQFITAGSAEEEVPDESIFCKQFIEALKGGGDSNNDGYITGSELGEYLQTTVINYSYESQHPQYGKIRNPNLDKGDFVFIISDMQQIEPVKTKQISITEETYLTYGSIKLTTEMNGSLYLDGQFLKNVNTNTIITLSDITTGTHKLEIRGDNEWSKTVNIYKDRTATITTEMPKDRKYYDKMVFVKGGCFNMGSNDGESDEKPIHEVCVDDFNIGKYEITQKQWREIMGNNPSSFKNCDNCSVEEVSWYDVQEFIKKLNQKTGQNYRLPTEAEWEYAAREGNKSNYYKYSGSNNIDYVAWYDSNSGSKTHTNGTKQANELGIFDMSGNVYEWCSDWYSSGYYKNSPRNNPQGPSSSSSRVYRGGSWLNSAMNCRIAYRSYHIPEYSNYNLGFRLARNR